MSGKTLYNKVFIRRIIVRLLVFIADWIEGRMLGIESGRIFGPDVLLHLTGTGTPPLPCALLGIERGKMHIRANDWIEPASRVSAMIGRITVSGEVVYCTRKETWYRTCIALNSENEGRREPRLPVRLPGAVIALSGDGSEQSVQGVVIDVSLSGMRLRIPQSVADGTMIFVEMASTLVVGEVRRCIAGENGHFEAGIEITDVLSDIKSPQDSRGTLRSIRRKLAEVILGEPITPTRKLR